MPVVSRDHLHFFGHYWLQGRPRVQGSHLACVDYNDSDGLPLTAYRWDGETRLDDAKFVQVFDRCEQPQALPA